MSASNRPTRAADVSPFKAGVTDAAILFALAMVGLFGGIPLYNSATGAHVVMPSGASFIIEGCGAVIAGLLVWWCSHDMRKNHPDRVRSVSLSVVVSIVLVLMTGTLLWLMGGIVSACGAAFITMPAGYRWLGFIKP